MPYIPKDRRNAAEGIEGCGSLGDLCYHVVDDILNYLWRKRAGGDLDIKWPQKIKWQDYAEILGMLESIKLEIYRRLVAPHEDEAIKKNGDIIL